jgi:hypothetical protein
MSNWKSGNFIHEKGFVPSMSMPMDWKQESSNEMLSLWLGMKSWTTVS